MDTIAYFGKAGLKNHLLPGIIEPYTPDLCD